MPLTGLLLCMSQAHVLCIRHVGWQEEMGIQQWSMEQDVQGLCMCVLTPFYTTCGAKFSTAFHIQMKTYPLKR